MSAKIEFEVPTMPVLGQIVTGVVTAITAGPDPVQPPPVQPPPVQPPPVQPPPVQPPPVQPPPVVGSVPAPWDSSVMLPVRVIGTLTVRSGNHDFAPNSNEIQVVQLVGNFTNGGYSSPPPVGQGCWVALGSTPGAHNATGWISGTDNANISLWPSGGNGMYMAMVLDPSHPQPPGTSFYSAN